MKKIIAAGMLSAAVLALTGCSSDDFASASGTGRISISSIDIDKSYASAAQSRATSYAGAVTADDLKLRLTSRDDDGRTYEFESLSDFESHGDFKVGTYDLEAYYGSLDTEGYDKPFFHDTKEVKVTENNTSNVALKAGIKNSLVDIAYDEGFQKYFESYSVDLYSVKENKISYTDYTQPVFVAPGEVKFYLTVKRPGSANEVTLSPVTVTALPKTLHHVTFSVKGGVGDAVLAVTIDDSVDTEPVEIELNDELFNTAGPAVTVEGFTSGNVIDIVDGIDPTVGTLKITAMARAGISKVYMSSVAPSLVAQGWPAGSNVDLTTLSATQQAAMKALGFEARGVWGTKSEMAVVDLSDVLKHLSYSSSVTENVITLTFEDSYTRVSEPVVLKVAVTPLEMTLSNCSVEIGSDTLYATLAYNGDNPQTDVTIQCKSGTGGWVNCDFTATEAPSTRSVETKIYNLAVKVPVGLSQYVIRAILGETTTVSGTIIPVAPSIEISSSYNAFAKCVYVSVTSSTGDATVLGKKASFYVSANGGSYTKVADSDIDRSSLPLVKISGLQPGTNYNVKATLTSDEADACEPRAFATEAATQLPNGDMESWCQAGSGSNWVLYYPGTSADASVWGTNNPMTTSQGVDASYCRISGTLNTSDAHGGSNAALVRTVGWGSGNTASGSVSTGIMKYSDAGLLHLGSSRPSRPDGYKDREGALTTDDLNCGLAFTSRPSSLSFWYKYSPKNSADKGRAEVYVYDASGNILASGTRDLASAGSYTEVTLPLSYSATSAKAAKIYVKFLSTGDRTYLEKNSSNFSAPSFASSKGSYLGSQLYIDDVTLNY